MIRTLLLVYLSLAASVTLSFAQSDSSLGKASDFAVLADRCVSNTGTTAVIGNFGIASGNAPDDAGKLLVTGKRDDTPLANDAKADAGRAYENYASQPVTRQYTTLGNRLTPGVHVINGNAVLNGILYLDGNLQPQEKFVIIVKGSLKTNPPTELQPSNSVLLVNGAEAKNVFWIIQNDVDLDGISIFQGNLIAQGDITLHAGVGVIGRAISLGGCISLNSNNIFLPTIIFSDLAVTKVADPNQEYTVGGEVAYTITARNAGPGTATGVEVEERFPAGNLEFLRTEPAGANFARSADGVYTWNVGSLENGEEASLKVFFKILTPGAINNKVSVGGAEPDPTPDNDKDEEPIEVPLPAANLSVTKTAAAGEYAIGDKVTYTITAQNAGPGAAAGVVVQENIPEGLEFFSAVPGKGSYDEATNLWTIGNLANGESAVLTLVFTIRKPGTLVNGVEIIGDNTDPIPEDNNTETPVNVPCPALAVAVTGNATVCVGAEETYTTAANIAATAYSWSLPGGWKIVSGEGTNTITVRVGEAAGDVTVSVADLCGNSSTAGLSVTVNNKPSAPVISGKASACVGTRLTFMIAGVPGATGYIWTVPATWKLVSGQNTASIVAEVGAGEGQVTASVINTCGTGNAATFNVAPLLAPIKTNQIVGDAAVCRDSQGIIYTLATVEEGVTYDWTVPTGWTLVSGNGTGTITVNATATGGTISVVATNACGTVARISTEVSITVPPLTPATIHDNSSVCEGLTYSVDAAQGATGYTWAVSAGFTITAGQGTNTIKVKAQSTTAAGQVTVVALNGTCGSLAASANMDVSLADGQLSFPKAFSPNGDGNNDEWVIKNLEKFANCDVTIFNRWGSEVFKTKNYKNDWRGKNLEQGTYFYKVRVTICDGVVKEFTGYTTIFR